MGAGSSGVAEGETLAVTSQLQKLQLSYAAALDDRDAVVLRAAFHPDAELRVFAPGAAEPSSVSRGHDSLGLMVDAMAARYSRTMHILSNAMFDIEGETASGQVYCTAHHLIDDGARARKFLAYVLYRDGFRHDAGSGWKISTRDIHFLWAEESAVLSWQDAVVSGRLS